MRIETSHHIEAGDRCDDGTYEYRYEYDIITFSEGSMSIVARSDVDEPDEAHFLRVQVDRQGRPLTVEDLASSLLTRAVDYLRANGKHKLNWLSGRGNGYESVLPPGA